MYTSNSGLIGVLGLGRLPLVTVGDVVQRIDTSSGTVENQVRVTPMPRWALAQGRGRAHAGTHTQAPVEVPACACAHPPMRPQLCRSPHHPCCSLSLCLPLCLPLIHLALTRVQNTCSLTPEQASAT